MMVDPWEDDAHWSGEDWRNEVANGDTRLGYVDWVAHQREARVFSVIKTHQATICPSRDSSGRWPDGKPHEPWGE